MKYIYFLFFIFLLSCQSNRQTYICGDRPCVNKKEFNQFFSKNLIIEVQTKKSKKNRSIDLAKINITTNELEKDSAIQNNKMYKKEQKATLRLEKAKLKEERKIFKINEKNRIKEEKKIAKLKKKNTPNKPIQSQLATKEAKVKIIKDQVKINKTELKIKDTPSKKNMKIKKNDNINDEIFLSNKKITKEESLCNKIKDCDIDKIADLLIKKGKQSDYPDITKN